MPELRSEGERMKYRKKPVEVEAIRVVNDRGIVRVDEWTEWWSEAVNRKIIGNHLTDVYGTIDGFTIETLEGEHLARIGDYIIRGVKGELYPCKPDIFEQTYEVVES